MSILVRPVREQLEHDRLVRHLQAKYKTKRKFTVAVNMGDEQVAPLKIGQLTLFPDLVLTDGRKTELIVEVESGESTNNLEAMAQWVHFSRARVPFHLYVPVSFYEAARRLCEANQARVTEIWTYRAANDGFDLVRVFNESPNSVRHAAAQIKRPVTGAVEKPSRAPSRVPSRVLEKPSKPAGAGAAGPAKKAKAAVTKGKPAPAKPAAKPAKSKAAKGKVGAASKSKAKAPAKRKR